MAYTLKRIDEAAEIVIKLLEMHEQAKELYKENYAELIAPYMEIVRKLANTWCVNYVAAAQRIITEANEELTGDKLSVLVMNIAAAAIELNQKKRLDTDFTD